MNKGLKRRISLLLLTLFVLPTISKSQQSIEAEYQICIKALDFIKSKDIDGFKGLLHNDSFKNTTDEQFTKGVDQLHDIVVGVPNPTMDMVLIMTSIAQYNGQSANIYSLGFPFLPMSRRDDEKGVQLVFLFSKEIQRNRIIGWKIRDFRAPLLRKEKEAKANIPTIEHFDFITGNIIEFRIVYKEKSSVESHFEISGDSTELKKYEINLKLDELFLMINESKIEKRDYAGARWLRNHPNVELDVLQFVFSNYDRQLYGIFEIANIVSDDPEISREYAGYLLVRHGSFRYFINKKENPTIVDKIIDLRMMIVK